MSAEYADVVERYKQALFRSLPDVPKAEIVWRFHFMLGATSYAIAGTDTLKLVTDWQVDEGAEVQDEQSLAAPDVIFAGWPACAAAEVRQRGRRSGQVRRS